MALSAASDSGRSATQHEWDAVLMVILDQNFDAVEIYEAGSARRRRRAYNT